jgi:hypothetical protein
MFGAIGAAAAMAALASPAVASAESATGPDSGEASLNWINVCDHGIAGDGVTDDAPALISLINGVNGNATFYFPAGSYRLASDVTGPSAITLVVDQGGILEPGAGVTLAVNGCLQAGPYRVFGGQGAVIGRFGSGLASPQWFGATPVSDADQQTALADADHDDAAPIRAAVEALYLAGGGTVFLSPGVYVLRSKVGSNACLIFPRKNVDIVGAGDSSVLKPANGLGGFNVIFSESDSQEHRVDNASFKNFMVDGNGVNNLQPQTGPKNKCAAIGIRAGSNIQIDRVTVVQNAGRQCFTFGNNKKPQSVAGLRLTNCYVNTVGSAVEGNIYQNDHSVVYLQGDGCVLSGNVFVQPEKDMTCTAYELHAKNSIITGNLTQNFDKSLNVVATVTDMEGVLIAENNFRGSNSCMFVYCFPDQIMKDVRIADNLFEQTGVGSYGAYGFAEASVLVHSPVEDMTFAGNSFTCTVGAGADRMPALRIGGIKQITARGNRFHGFTGPAVTLDAIIDGGTSVTIAGNEIIDCGRTTNQEYGFGINLESQLKIKSLIVRDNALTKTDPGAMAVGIRGTSRLDSGVVSGNVYDGVTTEFSWSETTENGRLLLEHVGTGNPVADAIPAAFGSTWTNPVSEDIWCKRRNGNSAEGWVRQR